MFSSRILCRSKLASPTLVKAEGRRIQFDTVKGLVGIFVLATCLGFTDTNASDNRLIISDDYNNDFTCAAVVDENSALFVFHNCAWLPEIDSSNSSQSGKLVVHFLVFFNINTGYHVGLFNYWG